MSIAKKKFEGFSDFEREAMRNRAKELLAEAKASKNQAQGESDVLAAINTLTGLDKLMAMGVHELVKKTAPQLSPKTWYGMPAYANSEGKVVCFFQAADKFKARYATLGFSDEARLDVGEMWPSSFALTKLSPKVKLEIAKLVKLAVR